MSVSSEQGSLFLLKTRQDEILADFRSWLLANPKPWFLFERFALRAIESGRERIGAGLICERIRWEMVVEQRDERGFKINNNYRAYLARLFGMAHPEHRKVFANRYATSADQPPRGGDGNGNWAIPVDPEHEARVERQLAGLLSTLREPS